MCAEGVGWRLYLLDCCSDILHSKKSDDLFDFWVDGVPFSEDGGFLEHGRTSVGNSLAHTHTQTHTIRVHSGLSLSVLCLAIYLTHTHAHTHTHGFYEAGEHSVSNYMEARCVPGGLRLAVERVESGWFD